MTDAANRRLAAIMMLDVVGYSQMMAEDEAGTLARLLDARRSILEPTLARFDGRIVKLMGDGVLAEFSSFTAATECAEAIQRAMAGLTGATPIRLRIGINLGEVIADGDDIYGDGVNVAARIEALAKPGGVAVSRSVHDQLGPKGAARFADGGSHQVKNIPHAVQVFHLRADGQGRVRPARRRPLLYAVLAVVLAAAGAVAWWQPWAVRDTATATIAPAREDKPSVMVMPFENLSGDAEQYYFSNGIAQNLITDLSGVSGLLVIARNTSFAFRDRPDDSRVIARELGVRYVVEGSVQKAGRQVRINASLMDATTGYQIWAGKMDREFDDLFALQDDVTDRIIGALNVELTQEERRRLSKRYTDSPEAYDLYLRAWEEIWRFNEDARVVAQGYLLQALGIAPDFALAKAILATTYTNRNGVSLTNNDESLDTAFRLAQEAKAQDPDLPQVQSALGLVHMFRREFDAAEAAFDRAIELDPNNADAYAMRAWSQHYAGDPQRALEGFEFGLKLNPRAPFPYLNAIAEIYFSLGEYDESLRYGLEAMERNPEALRQRLFLAAVYVELDRKSDAEWEVQEALLLQPELTTASLRYIAPYREEEPLKRLTDALREAGLPDG